MGRVAANLISIIFQPLLIPTYLFGGMFLFYPLVLSPLTWEVGKWVILLVHITTFVIPLLSLLLLRLFKNLHSLSMPERKERIVPFFYIAGFYVVSTWMIHDRLQLHSLITKLLLIISLLILLLAVITLFFKISAHSIGISGLFGIIWALSFKFPEEQFALALAICSIMAGLVFSSRLYLNAHKFSEVVLGALLGFSFCFVSVLLIV